MKRKLMFLSVAAAGIALGAVVTASVMPAAAAPSSSPAATQAQVKVGTQKTLPLASAQKAANVALQACAKKGFPQVTATVVDRDGLTIAQIRADGSTGATVEVSAGKARAAVGFQSPTSALNEGAKTTPGLISLPGFVILPGGLPIQGGGIVVAGIGVSGTPSGDTDAACAQAGIDAIS